MSNSSTFNQRTRRTPRRGAKSLLRHEQAIGAMRLTRRAREPHGMARFSPPCLQASWDGVLQPAMPEIAYPCGFPACAILATMAISDFGYGENQVAPGPLS